MHARLQLGILLACLLLHAHRVKTTGQRDAPVGIFPEEIWNGGRLGGYVRVCGFPLVVHWDGRVTP